MLANVYRAEPAAVVELTNGEKLQLGFVVEGSSKRLGYIYAVQVPHGAWLSFDVREVLGCGGEAFAGFSKTDAGRLHAVCEGIRATFSSSESLAWILAGLAHQLQV